MAVLVHVPPKPVGVGAAKNNDWNDSTKLVYRRDQTSVHSENYQVDVECPDEDFDGQEAAQRKDLEDLT